MRSALIIILALILCLGTFSYFADVKYVSNDGSLSVGRIGVQFVRDGQVYRMPPPPYRNHVMNMLAWFKGSQGSPTGPTHDWDDNFPVAKGSVPAFKKHLLYAKGLFWAFAYRDLSLGKAAYQVSSDGSSWSSSTAISNYCPSSYNGLGIYYDDNRLYYALGRTDLYYRWGTLNQDGTISWEIDESVLDLSFSPGYVQVIRDDNGLWVAVASSVSSAEKETTEVWLYSGSWSRKIHIYGDTYSRGMILPLGGDKYVFIYQYSSGTMKVWTSTDGGNTWSQDVAYVGGFSFHDAVVLNEYAHVVGVSSGDVKYIKLDASTSGSLTPSTVTTGKYSALSTDGNMLYLIVADTDLDVIKMFKSTDDDAWDGPTILFSGVTYSLPRLATSYWASGMLPLVWKSSSTPTYSFGYLPLAQGVSYFQVGMSDVSVNGKYVRATPNSALDTANITIRVYHNVDDNSTWVLAGQYSLASEAGLPWSGNTTSPWYQLLSGPYAQGNHTYYIKVELVVEAIDAITGQPISKTAYAVLSTTLNWQSMAPAFENLQMTETDMVEKVYVPIMVTTINALIMGTAIYLARRQRD